jgi:hypothetical protein
MRVASAAVGAAITLFISGLAEPSAHAQPSDEDDQTDRGTQSDATERIVPLEPAYEPDWGLDLGMGGFIGGVGVGGGAHGGQVGGLAAGPTLVATLERRLGDRLWLMLGGGGSYNGNGSGARYWGADASLGLRHALTSPDPIEVSWYAALTGGYASYYDPNVAIGNSGSYGLRSGAFDLGIKIGFALNKQLNDWLGLRVRVDIAEVGYARAYSDPDDPAVALPGAESWYAALVLAPSFAVRFAF